MARLLSAAVVAATILGLTVLGAVPASAAPNEERVSTTPRTAPTATSRSGTSRGAATPSPARAAAACPYQTVVFQGASYCPASIAAVRGTTYGTGTRVVLGGVTVLTVSTSSVTVAAWVFPTCPLGKLCGAGTVTLDTLTVAWRGTSRPAYGDVLNLFGVTIAASVTPVGYNKTGFCPIDWC